MKKKASFARYLNRAGWLYVLPAMAFYCVFMLYPILSSLVLVTRKWKGFNNTFVGLGNFVRMAKDGIFWSALGHNFTFMVVPEGVKPLQKASTVRMLKDMFLQMETH